MRKELGDQVKGCSAKLPSFSHRKEGRVKKLSQK